MDVYVATITIKAYAKFQKDGETCFHPALEAIMTSDHHAPIHLNDPILALGECATEEEARKKAEAWLGEVENQKMLMAAMQEKYAE